MLDVDIRLALAATLGASPHARVVHEMALVHLGARVDMAILLPGSMVGIEIKSNADTLRRLPTQARAYGAVFDRMVLVSGTRHFREAAALVPEWWGLVKVVDVDDAVSLVVARPVSANTHQNTEALASLLWAAEARAIATRHCVHRAPYMSACILRRHLSKMPVSVLAPEVVGALRARPATWLSPATTN